MGSKEKTQGKFSRLKQWQILFCPACGYAVALCSHTLGFDLCPLCLRRGKKNKLERRINKV